MPAAIVTKDEVLDLLLDAFRDRGYEGASLSELSAVTGLGRSSLYHHFPGGKEDMAAQVLAHLARQLSTAMFRPLKGTGTPTRKLGAMLDAIDAFYEQGRKACLLERLCASADRARFRAPLRKVFLDFLSAIEELCVEAGLPKAVARARAEDVIVRIEGALIVCAGTGQYDLFGRTIAQLRATVLASGH